MKSSIFTIALVAVLALRLPAQTSIPNPVAIGTNGDTVIGVADFVSTQRANLYYDGNTGRYNIVAVPNVSLGLGSGTAGQVVIDPYGRLGIGTSAPASPLTVETPYVGATATFTNRSNNYGGIFLRMDNASQPSSRNWGIFTDVYGYGNLTFAPSSTNTSDPDWTASKVVFASNGNVGIGTAGPPTRLTVLKTYNDGSDSSDVPVASFISQREGWGATPAWAGHIKLFAAGNEIGPERARLTWDGHDKFYVSTGTAGTRRFTVDGLGRVGIGTTSPGGTLQIYSNGDLGALKSYTTANGFGVIVDQYYSAAAEPGASYTRTADFVASTGDISSSQMRFLTKPAGGNPQAALVIGSTGNVGIGFTSPTEKLHVNGVIRASEIRVDTTGADYVFADDYPLKSLSEVEQHIKQHKHLPGIPSAAEMQANGVGLAELQTKLLAKIEELTLHQIAQQKRLDDQAARIATLERENAALRK